MRFYLRVYPCTAAASHTAGLELRHICFIRKHWHLNMTLFRLKLVLAQDEYWLSVYVLLSRLRSFDDLLLLRAPDPLLLADGPPQFLVAEFNQLYAKQTETLQATDAELLHLGHHSLRSLVTAPLMQRTSTRASNATSGPIPARPRKRRHS